MKMKVKKKSGNEDSVVETRQSAGNGSSDVIYSRDGNIAWSTLNPRVRSTAARNIVRHRVGPSVNDPIKCPESFSLFFPDENLQKIVDFTNSFAASFFANYSEHWASTRWSPMDLVEMKAFIGTLLLIGLHHSSKESI